MSFRKIKLIMFTLIITVGITHVQAQANKSAEVENAVNNLIEGMRHPSESTLRDLSSESLTYGHSSGKVETQEDFINTLVSGASVFEEIKTDQQTIHVLENTAIVRHTLIAKTNDPGKGPANLKLGIVLTWVKAEGKWVLLSRQAFKLPE